MVAKKSLPIIIISFILLLCFARIGAAQSITHIPALVSTEWLSEHLAHPSIAIFHIGKKEDYKVGHIPGAQFMPLPELIIDRSEETGLHHELPPVAKIKSLLTSLGVSDNSIIVLYYTSSSAMPWAARVYVTLDLLGLGERSALLDGGLELWREEKRPLSKEYQKRNPGRLTIRQNDSTFVQTEWILENLRNPRVILIDTRSEEQYDGLKKDSKIRRPGHITGAINIPFFEMRAEEPGYRFKTREELDELFADYGVKPESILVTYCGSGIWAGETYVAAKWLGYDVRFYDGSYQEWSADASLPIIEPVKFK